MNTITAIKPVHTQRVAFGSNTAKKSETHPNKAALSMFIPGSGQVLNGDVKGGFARLGVSAVALGTAVFTGLKATKLFEAGKGSTKAATALTLTAIGSGMLMAGNAVASAFRAYEGNKAD